MNVVVEKSNFKGEIFLPSSKSHVHRLLMGASLADGDTEIFLNSWSIDIETTKECMENLGSEIIHDKDKNSLLVKPRKNVEKTTLQCRESGSTLRFLLPLVSALGVETTIKGEGRLPERPIDVLVSQMKEHGCEFENETLPLTVKNKMTGGKFTFAGNISSQFITGLLFALPLLDTDSEIILTSPLESKSYVDMTIQVLETYGIEVLETENSYKVKGNQKYKAVSKIYAEGDWSGADFWVVAGCAVEGSDIFLKGLLKNSTQGDKEVVDLMEKMGGNISWENDGVRCSHSGSLNGIEIDMSQIPDALPILAVAGAMAKGETRLYNAGRVRIKESDRIMAMADGLKKMGVEVVEKEDELIIKGGFTNDVKRVEIDGYNDHRIVMAFAVALGGMSENGVKSEITDRHAIGKSYPRFFEDFAKLGGNVNVND